MKYENGSTAEVLTIKQSIDSHSGSVDCIGESPDFVVNDVTYVSEHRHLRELDGTRKAPVICLR